MDVSKGLSFSYKVGYQFQNFSISYILLEFFAIRQPQLKRRPISLVAKMSVGNIYQLLPSSKMTNGEGLVIWSKQDLRLQRFQSATKQ